MSGCPDRSDIEAPKKKHETAVSSPDNLGFIGHRMYLHKALGNKGHLLCYTYISMHIHLLAVINFSPDYGSITTKSTFDRDLMVV